MLTILNVIGTRPEAIKMAPVIAELGRFPDRFRSLVCVTGQHEEMLRPMLEVFGIQPDFTLRSMQPDQTLSELTAKLVVQIENVVVAARPDWLLVQGDTTSALAAGLVSYYRGVPFGHVEAGLRSGNMAQPFPEEANRRIVDLLASLAFAPTERAAQALIAEGIDPAKIHVTGNTIVDALLDIAARPFDRSASPIASIEAERLVLITVHRRETFGEPLREICASVRELADRFRPAHVQFVWPVHLNPRVRSVVFEMLSSVPNVRLTDPLDYPTMVHLLSRAELILSDSGGIQEESPAFGVPHLVLRDVTERVEVLEAGMVELVGTRRESITRRASELLDDPGSRTNWPKGQNPYGDGKAAARIVSILRSQAE